MKKTILGICTMLSIGTGALQAVTIINDPYTGMSGGQRFLSGIAKGVSDYTQEYSQEYARASAKEDAMRRQREHEYREQFSYEECFSICEDLKEDYTPGKHRYWIKVAEDLPVPLWMIDDLIKDLNKMKRG